MLIGGSGAAKLTLQPVGPDGLTKEGKSGEMRVSGKVRKVGRDGERPASAVIF